MNDNILWGGIGVLLAVGGAAVIGLEMTQADPLTQIYGVGVILAALLTVLIVAPSFRAN
ncbi:hypothetical protein [Natronocalculus amylovorans]|uniref:Uncharacterized protein n=1 Tax=Natronocalculus amylovorans TaxID=2917812 RepID=A0AAE3FXD3_9EURY|nr:hypothetical protein [Natronocalculus amylovorans]MCL9817074.1 hypothetical protein [Natronocalculus amylovorans]NUE02898.1 hypothetical protein [Halorubraceae archaeon YAN]